MPEKETFGSFLKKCRLSAGYGLRAFALAIGMAPSNLSNIEHGRANPPQDPAALNNIADTLNLEQSSKEREKLFNLAVAHKPGTLPADVSEFAGRTAGIPILLRTVEKKRMTETELEELAEYIAKRF